MHPLKTLIVGQGLAGTLVAYMLHQQNIPFVVMDPGDAVTSSRVAAGMFSPVSGKRKTLQPLVSQQIPFAISTYRGLELLLNQPLLQLQPVYQVFTTPEESELFAKKAGEDLFKPYINTPAPVYENINQPFGGCEVNQSGWVNCSLLLDCFASWLQHKSALIKASFDYASLRVERGTVHYQNEQFQQVIFCEGYQAVRNPFYPDHSILPCKGNVITISTAGLEEERILKRNGVYLVSLGKNVYRAGATHQWNDNSTLPDEQGLNLLQQLLNSLLQAPYTILSHQAAVRPTTLNREVVSEQHPLYPQLYFFNGLGTRGVLQAPWWASSLVEKIVNN